MCVLDREGSRVFASRALAVVHMAVYLTSCNSYLTSFCEPLLALTDVLLVWKLSSMITEDPLSSIHKTIY